MQRNSGAKSSKDPSLSKSPSALKEPSYQRLMDEDTQESKTLIKPTAPPSGDHLDKKESEIKSESKSFSISSQIVRPSDILDCEAVGIIRKPDLSSNDDVSKIVELFNQGIPLNERIITDKITVTKFTLRTVEEIKTNEFLVAFRNNTPEIAQPGKGSPRLGLKFTGIGIKTGIIGKVKVTDSFSEMGVHVIHVPVGKYAKVTKQNAKPMLLEAGTHVIHDKTLVFENIPASFLNVSDIHIEHNTLHLIRVIPGKYAKVTLDGKPILLEPRTEPYKFDSANFVFNMTADAKSDYIDQSYSYFSHGNLHYLQVEPGKLAKITIDNKPMLLSSENIDNLPRNIIYDPVKGFIINSVNVKFNKDNGFVNKTDRQISHGTIHYVLVPPGQLALVTVDGQPLILGPHPKNEPHIFTDTRNFEVNSFVSINSSHIQHGPRNILRVPDGQLALVQRGGISDLWGPKLQSIGNLTSDLSATPEGEPSLIEQPFMQDLSTGGFGDTQFEEKKSDAPVTHKQDKPTLTYKQYIPTDAREYRSDDNSDAYDLNDPQFKVIALKNANDKQIIHGSIKRIIPGAGQAAVFLKNGKLSVETGICYVNNPSDSFLSFFDMTTQRVHMPDKVKADESVKQIRNDFQVRHKDNKSTGAVELKAKNDELEEEINRATHIVCTTQDNVEIGLQLFFAFRIPNAESVRLALCQFSSMEGIVDHIKTQVNAAMVSAMKKHWSSEFNSLVESKSGEVPKDQPGSNAKATILTEAREEIEKFLKPYGIEISILVIEAFINVVERLRDELAKASMEVTKNYTALKLVNSRTELARTDAERARSVKEIEQKRDNDAALSKASTDLEIAKSLALAAKLKAESDAIAAKIKAEGDAAVATLRAEAEAAATRVKGLAEAEAIAAKRKAENAALREQGEILRENLNLTAYLMAEKMFGAIGKANISITPQQFFSMLNGSAFDGVYGPQGVRGAPILFQQQVAQSNGSQVISEHKAEVNVAPIAALKPGTVKTSNS